MPAEASAPLRLARGSAGLADDAVHRLGRLCADAEPLLGLFEVDGEVGAFKKRIVGAELLDITAIAALAGIHSDDFVIRAVFGSLAVETESYGHDRRSFGLPGSGRARKLVHLAADAKQNLPGF